LEKNKNHDIADNTKNIANLNNTHLENFHNNKDNNIVVIIQNHAAIEFISQTISQD